MSKQLIQCEDCGHMNAPEDTFMFQGEVALCKDEAACKQRQERSGQHDG